MHSRSTSKKTKQIKSNVQLIIGLIAILSITFGIIIPYYNQSKEHAEISLEFVYAEENNITEDIPLRSKSNLYVPGISLIKVGDPNPPAAGPCIFIDYTLTVTNESTSGEVLRNVVLTDPQLGGIIAGPNSGDVGNDDVMGVGEVWTYNVLYNITAQDKVNGQVNGQASVEAEVLGQGITVSDFSDDNSPLENDDTVIDLTDCQPRIGMIKTSMTLDTCLGIVYTFEVRNLTPGDNNLHLENIEIIDLLLGPNPIAVMPLGDNGNNLLEVGETWRYTVVYDVSAADIIAGEVVNQAEVTATVEGFPNVEVSDLSDNDSYIENDPTRTDLSQCQPEIALIKTSMLIDTCEDIFYTFEVTNQSISGLPLENIEITDELFGIGPLLLPPVIGDDGDNLLEIGETWRYENIGYKITQANKNEGEVINQAEVTANLFGLASLEASDLSDDDSILENDPTRTDLSICQPRIALIKQSTVSDFCDEITYAFEVTNQGVQILTDLVLTDPLFGNAPILEPDSGDLNNDGHLDFNEAWRYTVNYNITQNDFNQGEVVNQAIIEADVFGFPNNLISDLSDDNSVIENDPTITDLSLCQNPDIGLIKTGVQIDLDGDGCDDHIEYTFTVKNLGNVDLELVELNDPLLSGEVPGPFSGDIGNDGILSTNPNEEWIYMAIYDITQNDIDNGSVENQAEVKASILNNPNIQVQDLSDDDDYIFDNQTVVDLEGTVCDDHDAPLGLIKEAQLIDIDNDGCYDHIHYTFTLRNLDNINLSQVVLEDINLLGGVIPGPDSGDAGNDGVLSGGEEWIYNAIYDITQNDIDQGEVQNQATVTAIRPNNNQALDLSDDDSFVENDPTITLLDESCDNWVSPLGLIKSGEPVDQDNDGCNEGIEYTFSVTNSGPIDLEFVELNDPLLGNNLSGPDSGDDGNDGILSFGEVWTYIVLYGITQNDIDAGEVINQASVEAELAGLNSGVSDLSDDNSYLEDEPTITPVPSEACNNASGALGLIKEGILVDLNNDGCPNAIEYTFTLRNLGNLDLDTVILNDDLVNSISGPGASDIGNDNTLSVNEEWIYTASYNITQGDIDLGEVENQATVTAEPTNLNNQVFDLSDDDSFDEDQPTIVSTAGVCLLSPMIGLIKEGILIDQNNDGCPNTIEYTFTLRNLGDLDLNTVILNDDLVNSISGPGVSDIGNDNTLSVNEEWIYTASYSITQEDIDLGEVENQAIVTAQLINSNDQIFDLSDDDSFDENQPTIVSTIDGCIPSPLIGLIKEGILIDQNTDGCNETVQYTFTVRNNGNVDLDAIILADNDLVYDISGPGTTDVGNDNILSVGEEWTYTASYSITQEDIDLSQVENQATVTGEQVNSDNEITDLSDDENFDGDSPTITQVVDACVTDNDFIIFNGITPNGDDMNDYFRIKGIENYPDNTVKVFNRWGVQVYQIDRYGQGGNLFYGISEGRSTIAEERELPSGTYFYILEFHAENPGQTSYTGYIYINRD